MDKNIQFFDRDETMLFLGEQESLAKKLGKDFKALLGTFIAKRDEKVFVLPPDELLDYFDREAYGFSTLLLEDIVDDLSIPEDDPFIKAHGEERPMIEWMTLEDSETGYMYILLDPEKTSYCAVEQYLKLGKHYRFALSCQDKDYVVILMKIND